MSEHGRPDGEQVGYGRVERRAFRRQAEMFLQASPAVRARWVACTPRDAAGTLAVAAAAADGLASGRRVPVAGG